MLNESIFILTNGINNHEAFIELLKDEYNAFEVCFNVMDLEKSIQLIQASYPGIDRNIYIIYVHVDFLDELCSNILYWLMPSNFILVSFSEESKADISNYEDIFEFINISLKSLPDFDKEFFFKRLSMEIANKNRISLLQNEVKEFYEIGRALSSEKDPINLFEMIINTSINLTSSDAGTIYLVIDKWNGKWSSVKLDADAANDDYNALNNKVLEFVIAKNQSIEVNLEMGESQISKDSIFGFSVLTGKSLRIDDVYKISDEVEYKHNNAYDLKTGYITKSMLTIPMKDREDNITGVIQLINKKRFRGEKIDYEDEISINNIIPYDYTDELIMNSLAGQAAVVLENSLLYRDMQELLLEYQKQNEQLVLLSRNVLKAHEEERRRIAREIHDGPAQSAASLCLKLEVIKKYFQVGELVRMAKEMDNLSLGLRGNVKEIRTIIYNLKPSYLDDGLFAALQNQIEVFYENTGLKVAFTKTGEDSKVEYYLASTLYRILQEALSNVRKHSGATKIKVYIDVLENDVVLTVQDNGRGFDTKILKEGRKRGTLEGGFGLDGIRERVELVKGEVSIESRYGEGTILRISVPIF